MSATGSGTSSLAKMCSYFSSGDLPYTPNALVLFVYHKIDISESLGNPADGIRRVHFGTGSGKKWPT